MAKTDKNSKQTMSPDDKVQLAVEVPRQFRDDVAAKAKDDGSTLSVVVRALLQAYLDGDVSFETRMVVKK